MAAHPETLVGPPSVLSDDAGPSAPRMAVLPLPRPYPSAQPIIEEAASHRLAPARGLMLGLLLGASLWLGAGLLIRLMF